MDFFHSLLGHGQRQDVVEDKRTRERLVELLEEPPVAVYDLGRVLGGDRILAKNLRIVEDLSPGTKGLLVGFSGSLEPGGGKLVVGLPGQLASPEGGLSHLRLTGRPPEVEIHNVAVAVDDVGRLAGLLLLNRQFQGLLPEVSRRRPGHVFPRHLDRRFGLVRQLLLLFVTLHDRHIQGLLLLG